MKIELTIMTLLLGFSLAGCVAHEGESTAGDETAAQHPPGAETQEIGFKDAWASVVANGLPAGLRSVVAESMVTGEGEPLAAVWRFELRSINGTAQVYLVDMQGVSRMAIRDEAPGLAAQEFELDVERAAASLEEQWAILAGNGHAKARFVASHDGYGWVLTEQKTGEAAETYAIGVPQVLALDFQDALSTAGGIADTWASDAALLDASSRENVGLEGYRYRMFSNDPILVFPALDLQHGDGNFTHWIFLFGSVAKDEVMVVVVYAGLAPVASLPRPNPWGGQYSLEGVDLPVLGPDELDMSNHTGFRWHPQFVALSHGRYYEIEDLWDVQVMIREDRTWGSLWDAHTGREFVP